ncbi:hypothetical protein VNO77_02120 [Canavalia gladiata]|uniref:Uncharacterized protein n=1 Tax=Canavalia gladiata TaxID=3824 RepID=A0AAN9R5T4_CANGL
MRFDQRRYLSIERLPSRGRATVARCPAQPSGLLLPLIILQACWVATGFTPIVWDRMRGPGERARTGGGVPRVVQTSECSLEGRLHGTTALVSASRASDIEVKIIDSHSKAFVSALSTIGENSRVINSSLISCPHPHPISVPPLIAIHPLGDRWWSTVGCLDVQRVNSVGEGKKKASCAVGIVDP